MEEKRVCLLLHGFTGAPYEVEPLGRYLTQKGWETHIPTLAGHGGDIRKLKPVHRYEWIRSAEQAAVHLTEQYGSYDLVGFSMSGLIAAYLANRFPVRRLVLLNAAVYYVSPRRFAVNFAEQYRKRQTPMVLRKKKTPLPAIIQFMRLVHELKPEFKDAQTPTLIIQGGKDPIVHPRSARYIYQKMNSPRELSYFPDSRHMICLEPDAEKVFRKVENFLLEGYKEEVLT